MKSIFRLDRTKEDLDGVNQGMSNLMYEQVTTLSAVSGDNFPRSEQTFRWSPPSDRWWIPSKSYFLIDYELVESFNDEGVGVPLKGFEDIAPAMGMAGCLYDNMSFLLNDTTVSKIDKFVSEIDALKTRMYHNANWMNTTGHQLNFWKSSFYERHDDIDNIGDTERPGIKSVQWDYVDFLPNYDGGADTVAWDNAAKTFTFVSATALDTTKVQVGGYLEATVNGARSVSIITDVTGLVITVNETFYADNPVFDDVPYGASVAADNANLDEFAMEIYSRKFTTRSTGRNISKSQLVWKPPLSIFDYNRAIPGGGKFEIRMQPHSESRYKTRVVESLEVDLGPEENFDFRVNNIVFYACMVQGPRVESDNYFLDLNEIQLQQGELSTASKTNTQLDVPPSSYAFSIAFQDNEAGRSSLYSPTKYKLRNEDELKLTDFYLRYSGIQKPQPNFLPEYSEGKNSLNTDRLVELYGRSINHSGSIYDNDAETLEEWRERGMYLHFPWPKNGSDRSTRVEVSTQFSSLTDPIGQPPKVLLFSHYKKVAIVRIENNRVIEVRTNDV